MDARLLTPDEVARLLDACSTTSSTGIRNRALIAVLHRGGLRTSAALSLLPTDTDLDTGTLRVSNDGWKYSAQLEHGARGLLSKWLDRRDRLELEGDATLFCTLRGDPISASYVRALLARLAAKADIAKPVSAEALRRACALELVSGGARIADIQAHLGHRSTATTSRYLARIVEDAEPGQTREAMRGRDVWRP